MKTSDGIIGRVIRNQLRYIVLITGIGMLFTGLLGIAEMGLEDPVAILMGVFALSMYIFSITPDGGGMVFFDGGLKTGRSFSGKLMGEREFIRYQLFESMEMLIEHNEFKWIEATYPGLKGKTKKIALGAPEMVDVTPIFQILRTKRPDIFPRDVGILIDQKDPRKFNPPTKEYLKDRKIEMSFFNSSMMLFVIYPFMAVWALFFLRPLSGYDVIPLLQGLIMGSMVYVIFVMAMLFIFSQIMFGQYARWEMKGKLGKRGLSLPKKRWTSFWLTNQRTMPLGQIQSVSRHLTCYRMIHRAMVVTVRGERILMDYDIYLGLLDEPTFKLKRDTLVNMKPDGFTGPPIVRLNVWKVSILLSLPLIVVMMLFHL